MLQKTFLDVPNEPINYTKEETSKIYDLDSDLTNYFNFQMVINPNLTRSIVSFQANKSLPIYRWYKYKEAFSVSLVEYLFKKYEVSSGHILDPFAGSGTALFAASNIGINADGIELLPIGQQIIDTKKIIDSQIRDREIERIKYWAYQLPWLNTEPKILLPELRITKDAYPQSTKLSIEKYLSLLHTESLSVQSVLRFALLCILESISYTRKDGQYLRWDYRSGRKQGSKIFNKGAILNFEEAISQKLTDIIQDISFSDFPGRGFEYKNVHGEVNSYCGSCLDILPKMEDISYSTIITSPPYCNRYDYTRTYALELALLDIDEKNLVSLRQEMLSCTVENREKNLLATNRSWGKALQIAEEQSLLQEILVFLDNQKKQNKLNNNGIPRMIKGYFYEMACVIQECARVLKKNGFFFMINDNVKYAGVNISVDLILSDIAEKLGFTIENILILPGEKGNSSQQMGEHGRTGLRKCVYVWRKK